jgi:hypothetical protein
MPRIRQTFQNDKGGPIYISVEPWPECFELEPGDRLTLIYDADEVGDSAQINFISERELVVWPNGKLDQIEILFNGSSSVGRSWDFKHR